MRTFGEFKEALKFPAPEIFDDKPVYVQDSKGNLCLIESIGVTQHPNGDYVTVGIFPPLQKKRWFR